jgi:hypothetical protein
MGALIKEFGIEPLWPSETEYNSAGLTEPHLERLCILP